VTLHIGDCLDVMRTLPDASVDAVVTDPPYGLSFMGKRWDYDVPSVVVWAECLRVLKPGGHLLAFAGTRTQHRMAVRIEDAGFEIRDMIAWVYGSGFPKSLDVSKAIDKRGGTNAEFTVFRDAVKAAMKRNKVSRKSLEGALGNYMLSHYLTASSQPAVPNYRDYVIIRDHVGLGDKWDAAFNAEAEREVVGTKTSGIANKDEGPRHTIGASQAVDVPITAPATDAARQWQGWGTALKPALEPITIARKPLIGTVAENVLKHGTGGINVDGCRVGERWPANLIHDGSDEVVRLFPETTSGGDPKPGTPRTQASTYSKPTISESPAYGINSGSAARFFYTAKASRDDRSDGNNHPTVKPTDLMRYLCRLVTPPSGTVLDPFMGSGSTGKAAMLEGFEFIGIEREPQYFAIAEQRITRAAAAGYQPSLLESA
jgi:DNA modification methylase